MKYYPVFLRVTGRRCLVIGGGKVAQQKVSSLRTAGAAVTVLSPALTAGLAALAAAGGITHLPRRYEEGDLSGCFLAYAATNDDAVNAQIAREAEKRGVLLNVVDRPQFCDFIMPSILERGDLTIAVSTGGTSPALAKHIRGKLEPSFGPEYEVALRLLGRLRQQLAAKAAPSRERQRILTALVDSPLLTYLREHRTSEIDQLLATTAGNGVSLASLGVELTDS